MLSDSMLNDCDNVSGNSGSNAAGDGKLKENIEYSINSNLNREHDEKTPSVETQDNIEVQRGTLTLDEK